MVEWFNLSNKEEVGSACFSKLPFRGRSTCFNPSKNRRRSCFVSEFEKKALVCLHKLSFDDTDECCTMLLWGIEKPRAVRGSFFRQWAKRFAASNMWQSDSGRWYLGSRMEGAPIPDIVVSKGSVSNDNNQQRRRRVRTRWCRKQSICWWWRC